MKDLNPKLLSDLARVATRYDSKDWEQLAVWLDDQGRREQLRMLLLELASVAQTRRKPASRSAGSHRRTSRVREVLAQIRTEDADRADLLESIWLKLRGRELLPTLAAVRAFGEAMGSKGIEATRRDQAVTELMERLVELPGDSLEQRMRQTVVHDRRLGEEYDEWVRMILGRPPGTPNKTDDTSQPGD